MQLKETEHLCDLSTPLGALSISSSWVLLGAGGGFAIIPLLFRLGV